MFFSPIQYLIGSRKERKERKEKIGELLLVKNLKLEMLVLLPF